MNPRVRLDTEGLSRFGLLGATSKPCSGPFRLRLALVGGPVYAVKHHFLKFGCLKTQSIVS